MKHLIRPCFAIPGCAPSSALATLQVRHMLLFFLIFMQSSLGGTRQWVFSTFILLRFCEVRTHYSSPKKSNLKNTQSFSWWYWWFCCRAPVSDNGEPRSSVLQGRERKGSDLLAPSFRWNEICWERAKRVLHFLQHFTALLFFFFFLRLVFGIAWIVKYIYTCIHIFSLEQVNNLEQINCLRN